MFDRYNGNNFRLVSEPLINELWNNLAKNSGGTTPVTLGTDNWHPNALSATLQRRPFYFNIGSGTQSQIACYFYKHDRPYINDLTVFCNFADGLVRNSDVVNSPSTNVTTGDSWPNYTLADVIKVRVAQYYIDKDDEVVGNGSLDFSVSHFNSRIDLGTFLPENSVVPDNAKTKFFTCEIVDDSANDPYYSTKSIDTGFQSDRCLVWAEANISSTFGLKSYTSAQSGW